MKLTKFEVEKLSIDEMNAIKAGSGDCKTNDVSCKSDTGDADSLQNGDTDAD